MATHELTERTDAYELWEPLEPSSAAVVTCEHASVRLPRGWTWPEADAHLVGTHWSYDIGAADLALACAAALRAPALRTRFSRLLVDPNRPLDSGTLFRTRADGGAIALNLYLDEAEREARLERCYHPYYQRLDALVADHPEAMLLSVHSFTPLYEGRSRALEVGVLYDADQALGEALAADLVQAGVHCELNEPWSGREGLMHCVQHHATAHGRRAIELEVRQDLASSPAWRERFARILAHSIVRHA